MAAQIFLWVLLAGFAVAAITGLFGAPGVLNKLWGLCTTVAAIGIAMVLTHIRSLDLSIWEEVFLASAAFGAVFMAIVMISESRGSSARRARRRQMHESRWQSRQWERDAREHQARSLRAMRRRSEMRRARRKLRR